MVVPELPSTFKSRRNSKQAGKLGTENFNAEIYSSGEFESIKYNETTVVECVPTARVLERRSYLELKVGAWKSGELRMKKQKLKANFKVSVGSKVPKEAVHEIGFCGTCRGIEGLSRSRGNL